MRPATTCKAGLIQHNFILAFGLATEAQIQAAGGAVAHFMSADSIVLVLNGLPA